MSELAVFEAELERLEAADAYDDPGYDFVVSRVEELRAAAKAKAPAAGAPATQPETDPVAALVRDMEAAVAHPERFTDEQRDELVRRYNQAVIEAGHLPGAERVDVAQLQRDMLAAAADPGALSDEQRDALARRYNQAVAQGPERRTSEALRGDLASQDLATRMHAALALQERNELDDAEADRVVADYNQACTAAAERGPAAIVEALPPELRPAAEAIYAAQAALEVPPDPADAAVEALNRAIRGMKPPSLQDQLAALGLEAEQIPEPVSTTTQEA